MYQVPDPLAVAQAVSRQNGHEIGLTQAEEHLRKTHMKCQVTDLRQRNYLTNVPNSYYLYIVAVLLREVCDHRVDINKGVVEGCEKLANAPTRHCVTTVGKITVKILHLGLGSSLKIALDHIFTLFDTSVETLYFTTLHLS